MLLGLCQLLKGVENCIRLHLTFCLTTGIRLFSCKFDPLWIIEFTKEIDSQVDSTSLAVVKLTNMRCVNIISLNI